MIWASGKAHFQVVMCKWCSMSGAMMYWTLPPSEAMISLTSGVKATGEMIASEPVRSFTGFVSTQIRQWVDRYVT
jgi:hypothetical protein